MSRNECSGFGKRFERIVLLMTVQDQILFLCARQDFTPAHAERVRALAKSPVEWQNIHACAYMNNIAPLVYSNLLKCKLGATIPTAVTDAFKRNLWRTMSVKQEMAQAILAVRRQFPDEDIMLVKGAALDRIVYTQPWLVWSNDADLVFRRRREQFEDRAYDRFVAYFERMNQNVRRFDQNIEYELYTHHDLTMNGILPIDFERVWRDTNPLPLGDTFVLAPSPEDLLLFGCVNACRKRYFHLRVLCDLGEIVGTFPTLDWGKFCRTAREARCDLIVYTALRLAQQTLDVGISETNLAQLAIPGARRRHIDMMMGLLVRRGSLTSLSRDRGAKIFGRNLGWSLLLTYSTYRVEQLAPKFGEIQAGRKHSAPPRTER